MFIRWTTYSSTVKSVSFKHMRYNACIWSFFNTAMCKIYKVNFQSINTVYQITGQRDLPSEVEHNVSQIFT